jgi:hypothetical protein
MVRSSFSLARWLRVRRMMVFVFGIFVSPFTKQNRQLGLEGDILQKMAKVATSAAEKYQSVSGSLSSKARLYRKKLDRLLPR